VLDKANLQAVLDTLQAACAPPRVCSADDQKSIAQLQGLSVMAEAVKPDTTVEGFLLSNKVISSALSTAGRLISGYLAGAADSATAGANGGVNPALLSELTANGVKFTPENVIATARSPSGQVVFLETGGPTAGLQHIVQEHGPEFANMGVSEAQIPSVVMRAVTEGKIVGYQGSGTGRPIYELTINGQTQRIAITTSNNGFIVGANPRGTGK